MKKEISELKRDIIHPTNLKKKNGKRGTNKKQRDQILE